MRETTLSANQWLDQAKRLNFTNQIRNVNGSTDTNGNSYSELNKDKRNELSNFKISLNPMEIRTFIVKLSK